MDVYVVVSDFKTCDCCEGESAVVAVTASVDAASAVIAAEEVRIASLSNIFGSYSYSVESFTVKE